MVKEKMCKQMHLFATLPPQVWHRLAQPAHSKPVRLPKRKQWRPVWLAAPRFVKNVPLEPCSQVLVWLWLSRGPAETQQHLPRHTSPQQHRSLGRGLHPSPSPQGLCYVYWGEVNKQNNCFKWTLRWHLVHLQCCAIKICILFQDISFPSPQSPSALVHISWPPAPGDHPPAFCLHGFTSFLTLHVDEIKIHNFWCLDSSSQPNVSAGSVTAVGTSASLPYDWIISHCTDITHLVSASIHWGASGLLTPLDYCEQCYEYDIRVLDEYLPWILRVCIQQWNYWVTQ